MIKRSDIINGLNTIDQADFEHLINLLLDQGAFPDVMEENLFLEPFGINLKKHRTRKSPTRGDAELKSRGIIIEKSVNEDWGAKFKKDIAKNKGKSCKKFVFCTNQDANDKKIKFKKGNSIDYRDYCRGELGKSVECYIISQDEIVIRLENPKYFCIRRNILNIEGDFFCKPLTFLSNIQNNPNFQTKIDKKVLEEYAEELDKELILRPNSVFIVHNNDYRALLHSVGIWASHKIDSLIDSENVRRDYCFVEWSYQNCDLRGVDSKEISDEVESVIIIWDAHSIENLHDYTKFLKPNVSMVFVTETSLKDSNVLSQLNDYLKIPISEVHIDSIDLREVTKEEITQHESMIQNALDNEKTLMLKYESLIYFYSPVYLDKEEIMEKISHILNISMDKAIDLKNQLLKNDLAGVTGNIFWLKHSKVAKSNLDRFIGEGLFKIEDLI